MTFLYGDFVKNGSRINRNRMKTQLVDADSMSMFKKELPKCMLSFSPYRLFNTTIYLKCLLKVLVTWISNNRSE